MPLSVTHVLLTIIAVDLYRDFMAKHKKYFTTWTVLVAGVAGLLPDLDIPLNFVVGAMGYDVPLLAHGGFMHTPFFGLLFLLPFAAFWAMKKHRIAVMFLVTTFGILFHTFLDWLIGGGGITGIMALYPLSGAGFIGPWLGITEGFPLLQAIDAVILICWLLYIEWKHKIRDFI